MSSARFYLGNFLAASMMVGCPNALATINSVAWPNMPGMTLSGLVGDISSGWADILIPAFGKPTSFFFLDPQGLFHNGNEYSGSLGAGWRSLTANAGILSGYLFADYNHSDAGKSFWFLSPGVQALGDVVDFSANLYFPISSQQQNTGQLFASELGIYDFVSFSGHNQIDQLVNTFESVGNGGDVELGYRLPFLNNGSKLYAGGYYFAPKNTDHITGITGRFDFPVNQRVTVSLSDGYDNVNHNIVKAALSLSLGGRVSGKGYPSLEQRMLDPIHRDLAAIVGGSHTAQPIEQGEEFTGQFAVTQTNIWFFAPNAATLETASFNDQECSYEHPCSFTQTNLDNIDSISANANLYLASGGYINMSETGQITINAGQMAYGRSADYKAPAQGDIRPTLTGGIKLQGYTALNDLQLINDGNQGTAIMLNDNAIAVLINDVNIGNPDEAMQSYLTGIQLSNNDNLFVLNSNINAGTNDELSQEQIVAGIKISGGSNNTVLVKHSTINASINNSGTGNAFGIFVGNQNTDTIANNNNLFLKWDTITTHSDFESAGIFLGNYNTEAAITSNNAIDACFSKIYGNGRDPFGIFLGNLLLADSEVNNNKIKIAHSRITENADVASAFGSFTGNFQSSGEVSENQLSIYNSYIKATANTSDSENAFGLFVGNFFSSQGQASNNQFILKHDQISVKVDNENFSSAYGLIAANFDTVLHIPPLSNEIFFLKDNEITAKSKADFSNTTAISMEANNSQLILINNILNANTKGSDSGVTDLQLIGDNNFYILSNNQLNASTKGDFSGATGLLSFGDNDQINLMNNQINISTQGDFVEADGISIAGQDYNFNSTGDSISVNTKGDFGISLGVLLNANSGNATFSNDILQISSQGEQVDAIGINVAGTDNIVKLTHDKISATSAQENAYGLVDFNPSGSNTWKVDDFTFSHIEVDGKVQQCKEFFDGVCTN